MWSSRAKLEYFHHGPGACSCSGEAELDSGRREITSSALSSLKTPALGQFSHLHWGHFSQLHWPLFMVSFGGESEMDITALPDK